MVQRYAEPESATWHIVNMKITAEMQSKILCNWDNKHMANGLGKCMSKFWQDKIGENGIGSYQNDCLT